MTEDDFALAHALVILKRAHTQSALEALEWLQEHPAGALEELPGVRARRMLMNAARRLQARLKPQYVGRRGVYIIPQL